VRKSPILRRRRLAAVLLNLRSKSGLTADEAAKEIGVSKSTLSRIENGQVTPAPAAVEGLLRLYQVAEADIPPLVALAQDARKRGWWVPWNDVIPQWAVNYIGLESEAAEVSEFQPLLVPGLLQTEKYAEAIFRATRPTASDRHILRQVELRMLRQQREEDFTLSVVVHEAALRIPVGGSDVMRNQLHRLADVARQGRYRVQVLPAAAREHASMASGFIMLRYAESIDAPIVYLETQAGSLYVEEERAVQYYASLYQHLSATALSVADSARLISDIAETI
jgi:transcriptional regulator with XRE-family HTH domain